MTFGGVLILTGVCILLMLAIAQLVVASRGERRITALEKRVDVIEEQIRTGKLDSATIAVIRAHIEERISAAIAPVNLHLTSQDRALKEILEGQARLLAVKREP